MKRNEPDIKLKKAWDAVCENMEDNLAMMLLVLHNEYGFGKERLVKLLDAMEEMSQKFDEYQSDGVLDIKRKSLTERFIDEKDLRKFLQSRLKGVIPEEYYNKIFYSTTSAMYEAQAKSKHNAMKRQQTIPVAEAAEIQNKVLAMKDFLKDRSGNNAKIY